MPAGVLDTIPLSGKPCSARSNMAGTVRPHRNMVIVVPALLARRSCRSAPRLAGMGGRDIDRKADIGAYLWSTEVASVRAGGYLGIAVKPADGAGRRSCQLRPPGRF